ncbi:MAG: DUF309 domain-containing protein [Chloroflexi bacterium]|nr:DUF309 domain-containing protein [Chloroflexota bacterium]
MTEERRSLPPAPKPFRPRDELGRPLPAGAENQLDLPDFDALSLEENHALAMRFFDTRNFFAAHEAWETCWGQAKGTAEEEFFKGLAQLGAGLTHWLRGNPHGARALLGRALDRIGSRGDAYRGIDVRAFLHTIRVQHQVAAIIEIRGATLPPLPALTVPSA